MPIDNLYKLTGDHSTARSLLDDAGLPLSAASYISDANHTNNIKLGNADSSKREEWYDRLVLLNSAIEKASDEFTNTPGDLRDKYFPIFNSEEHWNYSRNFEKTDLSDFKSKTKFDAEKFFWGAKYSNGPTYVVRNSILIWKALSGQFGYYPFRYETINDIVINPIINGELGRWNLNTVDELIFGINAELDAIVEKRDEEIETEDYILGTAGINYEQSDIDFIMGNDDFDRFFSTTFDSDTISLIPLIYNFYLTSEYFQGINNAFVAPKDRVLSILLSTIANDNNFDSTPDLSRPASNAAVASSTGQDQNAAFNSAARDFILKMIIKTPIDILKGLTELIDPHVAISKVIKTGTGFAFNALAAAIDPAVRTANEQITAATEDLDLPIPIEPNLTGEDLLSILFCLVENGMNAGIEGTERPTAEIPENFFPRISIDGVDFTGTVSGMLMMPPSPLGLIYLLLELLKNDITNQTQNVIDASAQNANENECSDQVDPVTEESPCGDTEEQT